MTRRLLLSYLTVTLFVLLLLEIPLAVFFQQRESDRLISELELDAMVLATIYEESLEHDTELDPRPALDYAELTGARVVVLNTRGISQVDTDLNGQRDFSTRPEFADALAGSRARGTRHSNTLDADFIFAAVPVASAGSVYGALRLTFPTREVDSRVRAFQWGLVAVGGVILLVIAALGWAFSQSVTRPIRNLRATAGRFSSGDLTRAEPDPHAPPELVDLEAALNVMALRLDRLIGQQRAFVADASHQLRTPLTALRLRLENLRSSLDEPRQTEELDEAVEEIGRLDELVTNMLHLASAEQVASREPCNLTRLASERVNTWTAVADQSSVALELIAGGEDLWVDSVAGGIEQILDNLLSNAINAAPEDSVVTVTVADGGSIHRLSVADNGPGLTAQERVEAVERFWRADASKPGSGLGLAIVTALLEASGGSLRLEAASPSGLVAIVTLQALLQPEAAGGPPVEGKSRIRRRTAEQ